MKWRAFEIQREPGFRLNLTDLVFIGILMSLGGLLHVMRLPWPLVALPPYLGLSFFLFCNVFRIGNRLEPWWYVPFALVCVWGIGWQQLEWMWWLILAVLEPWKWLLIGYRIRRGGYLGVGYRILSGRMSQN